jgi:hypothetical protein
MKKIGFPWRLWNNTWLLANTLRFFGRKKLQQIQPIPNFRVGDNRTTPTTSMFESLSLALSPLRELQVVGFQQVPSHWLSLTAISVALSFAKQRSTRTRRKKRGRLPRARQICRRSSQKTSRQRNEILCSLALDKHLPACLPACLLRSHLRPAHDFQALNCSDLLGTSDANHSPEVPVLHSYNFTAK